MSLELIRIRCLRNISEAEISPHPCINLIIGKNGSGKTSLLEAIYLLGRGRSFRSRRVETLIQRGTDSLDVFGVATYREGTCRIGLRKSGKGTEVHINGERISKLSKLVKTTAVHVITPNSHELLERGSELRRRFLEWGVFHVEPAYRQAAHRYHRALSQRNAALKKDHSLVSSWNAELVEWGEKLNGFRESYFLALRERFLLEAGIFFDTGDLDLVWKRGWPSGRELPDILKDNQINDIKQGFTRYGPHRADLSVRKGGDAVNQRTSRGEQKLAVICLVLAQTETVLRHSGNRPVLLIDDLNAELDQENRIKMMSRCRNSDYQVFITATGWKLPDEHSADKVFHVEHGVITETGV